MSPPSFESHRRACDGRFHIIRGCTYQYKGSSIVGQRLTIAQSLIKKMFGFSNSQNLEIHVQPQFCNFSSQVRGVFRTFELRVLTVIDCPKIAGAKGGDSNRLSQYYGCYSTHSTRAK